MLIGIWDATFLLLELMSEVEMYQLDMVGLTFTQSMSSTSRLLNPGLSFSLPLCLLSLALQLTLEKGPRQVWGYPQASD